jgi:molecular chaperone DnaK
MARPGPRSTSTRAKIPDALNNIAIGRFMIEGLRDAPAGNPLITTFSLDVNGILQVTSREKESGLVHSITIDNAISAFTGDKLAGRARADRRAVW